MEVLKQSIQVKPLLTGQSRESVMVENYNRLIKEQSELYNESLELVSGLGRELIAGVYTFVDPGTAAPIIQTVDIGHTLKTAEYGILLTPHNALGGSMRAQNRTTTTFDIRFSSALPGVAQTFQISWLVIY